MPPQTLSEPISNPDPKPKPQPKAPKLEVAADHSSPKVPFTPPNGPGDGEDFGDMELDMELKLV